MCWHSVCLRLLCDKAYIWGTGTRQKHRHRRRTIHDFHGSTAAASPPRLPSHLRPHLHRAHPPGAPSSCSTRTPYPEKGLPRFPHSPLVISEQIHPNHTLDAKAQTQKSTGEARKERRVWGSYRHLGRLLWLRPADADAAAAAAAAAASPGAARG